MKKKLLSAVLLSSVLLSACASKDTDKKDANDTPDTSEAVTEESAEETTEATTTETEATEKSEETKPSETTASPYEKAHVARWVDANLNFAHDADDSYLLNGVNVSMADYYSALDKDPVMKCVDAFYNLYRSPLGYDEVFESALTECDYITTTQIEFESPGITEGEVPTDTVRIDEENCVTYYTIDVPQLTLSGSDIDKANKAIIEFAQASDPWFGPPKVRYQHIERDDGSKTVIFFLGDGYDDSEFKVFNFDKDNKLMSADAVIESAGWEPAVFKTEAKKTIAQALVYADEIAIKAQGFGINSDYISAIDDPSDILVNKNGNLVVFAYSSIAGTQGYFRIPLILDYNLELSPNVLEEEFVVDTFEWIIDESCDLDLGGGEPIESDMTIDDINTAVMGNDYYITPGLVRFLGYGTWYEEGATKDPWVFSAILGKAVTEDTTYKYEIYFNGELVNSDSVTMVADPFFRQIEVRCEYDIKPGIYCFVLYDGNDSDKILGAHWWEYRE